MLFAGIIRSIIGGYRYFCDGWRSCDNTGNIIEHKEFMSRQLDILLLILVGSILVTFLILRAIDKSSNNDNKKGK